MAVWVSELDDQKGNPMLRGVKFRPQFAPNIERDTRKGTGIPRVTLLILTILEERRKNLIGKLGQVAGWNPGGRGWDIFSYVANRNTLPYAVTQNIQCYTMKGMNIRV